MAWPVIAIGKKLATLFWSDVKGYIDGAPATAHGTEANFAGGVSFGGVAYTPGSGGSLVFTYNQVGKRIWATYVFTFGATVPAAGTMFVSLPQLSRLGAGEILGIASIRRGGTVYLYNALAAGTVSFQLTNDTFSSAVSNTVPFTWTSGDRLELQIEYEAA